MSASTCCVAVRKRCSNDLIIAATVLARQAGLVTANVREFRRVPGLQVVDWTQP
jgi:predicted nucleic acid-binding protein